MKIYLARHGQNEDNAKGILNGRRDLPLTEAGKRQARELAEKIKGARLKFDLVLSSPLSRALETARIISTISENPVPKVEDLLIERDFGEMSGIHQSKIKEICAPDILETDTITYFLSPTGAETFPDLLKRAGELLEIIMSEFSEKNSILLVGHGDFGKMIYSSYYDLPWRDVLTQFHFGNSEILLLSKESKPEDAHIFEIEQFNH